MFAFFEKRIDPYPSGEPDQPPGQFLAFLWHYSRPVWPWLLLMTCMVAAVAIIEVILFGFLGSLVDWLADSGRENFLRREAWNLAGMAALIIIGLPALILCLSLVMYQVLMGNYPMIARWQMHRYLLRQSMNFFANEFAGRVATKVMQTSLAVRETVMTVLDVMVYVAVYFVSMVVIVAQADIRLAAPLALWIVVYGTIVVYFVPRLQTISRRQADSRSVMTGRVVDSYTNISTVKLFSHSMREAAYAREGMDAFLGTVHGQMRLVSLFYVFVYLNNSIVVVLVAGISIWLWLGELVTVGAIAVAISLALRLNGMSQWIMWEISTLFENIGVVHDGMAMMAMPQEIKDSAGALELSVPKGRISFEKIKFHYGKDSGVIEDLSLEIEPGEKIGLVGRSGAGKTTLTNLLLRFYDLEGGTILIDGQSVASVTQDSLRAQIGVVSQETSLLHRSIRDNIAYGKPDATDAQIIDAAKRASAWSFIQDMADQDGRVGLDAHVGERGVKLSGGQRQRTAIARVFLKDAPILVLDEATSALDSEVEAAIQENLFDLMEGKTVIAIAHRLSTIAQMDRLIVLDMGKVVETGTHQDLVAQKGIYANLWARQSGGFIGVDAEKLAGAAQ